MPPIRWTSPFTDARFVPSCIEVATNGDVIMGDFQHVRIARFRSDGRLICHWNPAAPEEGPATAPAPVGADRNRPFAMAASREGGVLVSLEGRPELCWFDAGGSCTRIFAQAPEHMFDLVETSTGELFCCAGNLMHWKPGWDRFQPWPSPEGQKLTGAGAVVVDERHHSIIVYDSEMERIEIFADSGRLAATIGNLGRHDMPRLALTPDGRLLFSGLRTRVPLVFDRNRYLLLGAAGNVNRGLFGNSAVDLIRDLAVGADGKVYLMSFVGRVVCYEYQPAGGEVR